MQKKKVAFGCCSRADYGIVRNYLRHLNDDSNISLEVLVTGSLLKKKYNHEVDLIKKDGLKVAFEADLPLKETNNKSILHAMSICLDKFGSYFYENKYDLLIVLGDRYEMLPMSTAAAMQRIPILHLHGGEATYGNYDEFIRHSITKMSTFHITATEEYKNRVIQLGEHPKRVYNLGALGAENCTMIDVNNVPEWIKKLKQKTYFVVLFNPETITGNDTNKQVKTLLQAINNYKQYQFMFIGSNSDTSADVIRENIKRYAKRNDNAKYIENLHPDAYHYLLKNSCGLIGNSSSGIIETPSLGVFTINIGQRQAGRVRGKTVIDIDWNEKQINNAIKDVLNKKAKIDNTYYKKNAAKNYYNTTIKILNNIDYYTKKPKRFYDIKK